jgi:hypothetical protein
MRKIDFFDGQITKIRNIVGASINFFNERLNEPDRKKGCYLVIMEAQTSHIILIIRLGEPAGDKDNRHLNTAMCIATVVYNRQETDLSSHESRNELGGFPAGAVLCDDLIWSINGLGAKNSEAVATVLAIEYTNMENNPAIFRKNKMFEKISSWNDQIPQLINYLAGSNTISTHCQKMARVN